MFGWAESVDQRLEKPIILISSPQYKTEIVWSFYSFLPPQVEIA
jgi:hypothetical protein